jgi:integrase
MAQACTSAGIEPPISFHGLRHSYASLAVQAGMPLLVLARNLGHADTRMVERHYGHLSDRYLREEVNRFAPALKLEA